MSLRINTNVAALNSYNNLSANQTKLEASFQQLSSGLRINKAADDAAGLSIAQGLTSQINGLTQAVSNANDGINVAQIADGALGTTQDILQRMRSLVVKAGNEGTQDSKSLTAIQAEIKNLNTQLDNISSQTKFGQTNLLDGTYNNNFQVGANGNDTIALDLSDAGVSSAKVGGENLNSLNIAVGASGSFTDGFAAALYKDVSGGTDISSGTDAASTLLATKFGSAVDSGSKVVTPTDGSTGWIVQNGAGTEIGRISQAGNGSYLISKTDADGQTSPLATVSNVNVKATANITGTTVSSDMSAALSTALGLAASETFTASGDAEHGWAVSSTNGSALVTVSDGVYTITDTKAGSKSVNQVVGRVNSNAGAVAGADQVLDYSTENANDDLNKLDKAIDGVSAARSQIGAVQNQLTYTVSNLQTAITNVTASRSNLTDADLAQQVTAMTQSQILTQAATSVLAQANSAPQAILKLLQ